MGGGGRGGGAARVPGQAGGRRQARLAQGGAASWGWGPGTDHNKAWRAGARGGSGCRPCLPWSRARAALPACRGTDCATTAPLFGRRMCWMRSWPAGSCRRRRPQPWSGCAASCGWRMPSRRWAVGRLGGVAGVAPTQRVRGLACAWASPRRSLDSHTHTHTHARDCLGSRSGSHSPPTSCGRSDSAATTVRPL